jgi:Kef-type K+ transport system membrane component KefB
MADSIILAAAGIAAETSGRSLLHDPVLQFTVLVSAALVMQLTVERARLPGLIGLIALGMVLGPGGTGVLPEEPIVSMLGHIGLIYVMFIAGLEIDLDLVGEHRREAVAFGAIAFAASALPALGAALLLGFDLTAAVLLGSLVASHTLLAHPILIDLGLVRRLPVVTAVGGTLLTDTLALVVLAIVVSLQSGHEGAFSWLLPLGALALLSAVALVGVPRLSRVLFVSQRVTRPERALFALVVLMVLATAAEVTGTDKILGAFLAGICLNRSLAQHERLREHIEFVGRMLFVPFFFIWTGTLLEFEAFTGAPVVWVITAMLLGAVVIGKTTAAWTVGILFDYRRRARLLMASMTLPQAAATLAVTITAEELGLLDEVVVDAVIIVIVVTCLIGPLLTSWIGKRIVDEDRREPTTTHEDQRQARAAPMHERSDKQP